MAAARCRVEVTIITQVEMKNKKNCGQSADINYVYTSTYFKHNIIHNILPYVFLNNAVTTVGIVI